MASKADIAGDGPGNTGDEPSSNSQWVCHYCHQQNQSGEVVCTSCDVMKPPPEEPKEFVPTIDDPFKELALGDLTREEGLSLTLLQIDKAYRQQAIKKHPDKNPGDPTAAAKFRRLHVAMEHLISADSAQVCFRRPERNERAIPMHTRTCKRKQHSQLQRSA